jgi:hypothetical protein
MFLVAYMRLVFLTKHWHSVFTAATWRGVRYRPGRVYRVRQEFPGLRPLPVSEHVMVEVVLRRSVDGVLRRSCASTSSSRTGAPDVGSGAAALTTGLKVGALAAILVARPVTAAI